MSVSPLRTQRSLRFFSTFHRYMTQTAIHARAPSIIVSRSASQPPSKVPKRLYASVATSTAASNPESIPSAPQSQTSQPPTHYNLFPKTLARGPPPSGPFTIDPATLRKEFLSLQSLYHPDRHPSPSQKSRAEATSAHINSAYRTLLDPLARAQYLLSLRGIEVAEDETAKTDDMELLEEVIEVRNFIDNATEAEELEGTRKENEGKIREGEGELQRCFEGDDLEGASRECVRMRYWRNVRESIDGWEKGSGGGLNVH